MPSLPKDCTLILIIRLLAAQNLTCLWLSVLQYWVQFIGNYTYQLLLGTFDCKPPRIVISSDLLGHCQDYYQHKLSELFHCILQVIYVVLAIILKKSYSITSDHILCLFTKQVVLAIILKKSYSITSDHILCLFTEQVHFACPNRLLYNSSNGFHL